MSSRLFELSREQVKRYAVEYNMKPEFLGQSPYLALSATHEMMAVQMPDGLFHLEILNKHQIDKSLITTIHALNTHTDLNLNEAF